MEAVTSEQDSISVFHVGTEPTDVALATDLESCRGLARRIPSLCAVASFMGGPNWADELLLGAHARARPEPVSH